MQYYNYNHYRLYSCCCSYCYYHSYFQLMLNYATSVKSQPVGARLFTACVSLLMPLIIRCCDIKNWMSSNNFQREKVRLLTKRLNYLPWQVQSFKTNNRFHVTTSHFQWNVNTTGCNLHQSGYFRLTQNQGNEQLYLNHSILSQVHANKELY